MRHLIVCFDGTWNSPDQDAVTNVRRLFNVLDTTDDTADENEQVRHYVPGVGVEGDLVSKLVGGALGVGLGFGPGRSLAANVLEGYHWLITNYQDGDRIALFGFSRGAYTARSLAGLITKCGLIDTSGVDEQETWRRIKRVYRRYQVDYRYEQRPAGKDLWRDGLTFRFDPVEAKKIPVHFIGVWDTVGSLGIPDPLRWIAPAFSSRRYEFNDVKLNPYVRYARHAVAMDERRGPFTPTLWEKVEPPSDALAPQDVQQVWFPGSHMDVGGGHLETGLSDRALQWMIKQAQDTIQLGFHDKAVVEQVRPNYRDLLHDDDRSALGWLNPVLEPVVEPFLTLCPRAVPLVDPEAAPRAKAASRAKDVDDSVYDRQRADTPPITSGPYRPTRKLAAGEAATVEILACEPWNETGLYLEPGDYTFHAEGEWLDQAIPSGPEGSTGLPLWREPLVAVETLSRSPGTLIGELSRSPGTLIGEWEKLYRRLTGNERASFVGARREPDLPWMSLVGYVANDAVTVNGKREPPHASHQRIDIRSNGGGTTHQVSKGGYLYAFANDAWGFYGNNTGCVRLTVTRALRRTADLAGTRGTAEPTPPEARRQASPRNRA
jgi:uncharacterized protein (DUF2235 family)